MGLDPKEYNPRAIKNKISGAKNELLSPVEYERFAQTDFEEKVVEIYTRYEQKLKQNPKPLIIDEVDYLVTNNVIEILRDLHDRTGCPMILVGMVNIDKKLSRYPHLKDRIYKAFKFEPYDKQDIMQILSELSEIPITNDGLEYLATRHNQLRQIVKLINKIEKLAKTNELKELNEKNLRSILNEGQNITALQTSKQIFA